MTTTAFATSAFPSLRPASTTFSTSARNSLLCAPKRQVVPARPIACAQLTSSPPILPEQPVLQTCTPADLPELAEIAADAFYDNPVFQHMLRPVCSDERDYVDTMLRVCGTAISDALGNPEAAEVRSDSQRRGLVIWYHPYGLDKFAQLGSAWRLLCELGPRKFFRPLLFFLSMSSSTPKQPHVYLEMIACRRDAQRKGLGSALMKEVIRECEERNVDAYLENSNVDNTEFYNKHGFRDIGYIGGTADDGSPRMMQMCRSAEGTKS